MSKVPENMTKNDYDELDYQELCTHFHRGTRWRHFKGGIYEIEGIQLNASKGHQRELGVNYRDQGNTCFYREFSEWFHNVKVPYGSGFTARFSPIIPLSEYRKHHGGAQTGRISAQTGKSIAWRNWDAYGIDDRRGHYSEQDFGKYVYFSFDSPWNEVEPKDWHVGRILGHQPYYSQDYLHVQMDHHGYFGCDSKRIREGSLQYGRLYYDNTLFLPPHFWMELDLRMHNELVNGASKRFTYSGGPVRFD